MRKIAFFAGVTLLMMASCKSDKTTSTTAPEDTAVETSQLAPMSPAVMESAIIYEANIRQYSPEGSFEAFTRDIPQLKELGVKIIWLMPVFPISETKRKARGDLMIEDIEDPEERKKYLGSYYAVSDFKKINPEFGTLEDFRKLVKTAHENDIYVILDWVPNHTGWDHTWLTEHPEFYTRNADGEITDPIQDDGTPWGWTDVADLNYDNPQLRETMIGDMLYWVKEEGIDGFRCDVAGAVPLDFWQMAIPQLRAEKDLFMLAEAWEPELMQGDLFDMAYGWDGHHTMNAIAKGEKKAEDWFTYWQAQQQRYEANDILMNFVTNHDENSWAGTIDERMGPAAEAMTALAYCIPGMPLIYSGQEYGLDHRLKFFEKDSIPKTKGMRWEQLARLGQLKTENTAMHGGKNSADMTPVVSAHPQQVLAFKRSKENSELVYLANMSDEVIETTLELEGSYQPFGQEDPVVISPQKTITLQPWEYRILLGTH